MSGPILRTKRLKILEPLQDANSDEILVWNSETKEVSSLPKESVFDADNIKTEIAIDAPVDPTAESFADAINALPLFAIDGKTIPTFKAVTTGENPVVYYVELLNLGKGSYGVTGTQLTIANLKITTVEPTSKDIADLSSTQIIDLGNQGDDVVTAMNRQMPNITIQDQNDGYTIVKGIFLNGQFHEYLWIGTAGTYGRDVLQTTDQDFKELSSVSQGVARATDSYSGTVKTDVYKENPTVYVKETIDQMFAGLGNVITTVKPILSSALATQNVAGFVTYINALNPVLVVGASEIVKYNLTDTGRVFELNLRGRSFGVGQPAIVAADVLEVTEFLNKDLKLSNYPNTRNDGQLPTNKVLSTDANGNLKMYTTAVAPAPYLLILIPDSTSPSTTTNFVLKGAFFTPTMTVVIAGQTINYITFISDNEVRVNVTTGAAEGMFSVTLNNGIQAIFNNALLIVLGTVFTPKLSEWGSISGNINLVTDGYAKVSVFDSVGSGTWDKVIDNTKNYSIRFELALTPLGAFTQGIGSGVTFITLLNSSDLTTRYTTQIYNNSGDIAIQFGNQVSSNLLRLYGADFGSPSGNAFAGLLLRTYEFRKIGSNMFVYIDNVLKYSFIPTVTENLLLKVSTRVFDVKSIKYIELV